MGKFIEVNNKFENLDFAEQISVVAQEGAYRIQVMMHNGRTYLLDQVYESELKALNFIRGFLR